MSDRSNVHPVSITAGSPRETVIKWLKATHGKGPKQLRITYPPGTSKAQIMRHLQSMRVKLSGMRNIIKQSGEVIKPFKMRNVGIGVEDSIPYLDLLRVDPREEESNRIAKIMEGLDKWSVSNADNR